ncbi:hypothetical protein UlMin_029006 [Ulmus minor]
MDQLPNHLVLNIFSRLPIETLFQLKSVCKLWSQIIENPHFANLQLEEGIKEPGLLLLANSLHKPNIFCKGDGNFLHISPNLYPFSFKYVFHENSCNGLLCFLGCLDEKKKIVFLCNPFRKEVLALPPSRRSPQGFRKYGLGFDNRTRTYKVVCVFKDEYNNNFGAEVYTLGSNSWREISLVTPFPEICLKAIFVGGFIYWVSFRDNNYLISFDVGKEELSLVSCPEFRLFHLVDLGGVLGIVDCSSNACIEIWMMKDSEKRKNWVKEYRIDISSPSGFDCNIMVEILGLWKNGEVLLRHCQTFLCYNPNTKNLRYIHIPGLDDVIGVFGHTGSLVSLSWFEANL